MVKRSSPKSSKRSWGGPASVKSTRDDISWFDLHPETTRGIIVILLLLAAVLAVLSFFGLSGTLGAGIVKVLSYAFGWGRFLFPLIVLVPAIMLFLDDRFEWNWSNTVGIVLLALSITGIFHIFTPVAESVAKVSTGDGGGYLGVAISYPLLKIMGTYASFVVLLALLLIAVLLVFRTSLQSLMSGAGFFAWVGDITLTVWGFARSIPSKLRGEKQQTFAGDESENEEPTTEGPLPQFAARDLSESGKLAVSQPGQQSEMPLGEQPAKTPKLRMRLSTDLLETNVTNPTSGNIDQNKEIIQRTLDNFGIPVEMGEVSVGPTVTQYTLKPDEGVKLSQITTLQNDLALALAAHPIRIEAPIPGKSLVGIEIPNQKVSMVRLKEIIDSQVFKKRSSNLAVALGKDVGGNAVIAHLDAMPHLLIAGATGSGKSVMINSLIVSLLFQSAPEDLRLILVDPKRVEMTVYNDIPYLLTPVITETKKTINALRWLVSEMDRRYEVLQHAGKRNIASYNKDAQQHMPYIVLVIDELADLMAVAANDVEAAIVRLAQMARAVGIHLVVATQRPSVDVITGLIKANITSRVAFTVASLIDSRTIIDSSGAEKLLGRGDMLFVSAESSKPKRIQGVFVSDQEIGRVCSFLKEQGEPEYDEEVTVKTVGSGQSGGVVSNDDNNDPMLEEATEIIVAAGKGSASMLQRRLRLGYARAARILDILEERGIIGPADGAKPREVLVSKEQFAANSREESGSPEGAETEEANEAFEDTTQEEEEENFEEKF